MFQEFQNLSPREKVLLGSLVMLVVWTCYYFLILDPQMATYMGLKASLEQIDQELRHAQKTLAEEKILQEESRAVNDKIATLLPLFNTRMYPGYVLVDFNWQAYQCGVTLEKVKPLPVVDRIHYLEIPVTLHVKGPFNDITAYLKILENLAVLSEIRRADFRPANQEEGFNLTEITSGALQWQQSDEVRAQIDLVLFTLRDAKLNLDQGKVLAEQWLTGRPKAFESVNPTSPLRQMPITKTPQRNPIEAQELIGN